MRARRFELRLLGSALVAAWGLAAVLVLLAYRPGGPLDVAVGITMLVPLAIAICGVIWPPVARGRDTYPMVVALGVGSLLLLLPSIGGVLNQLQALGSQTLMPSLEAAYPWLLALAGQVHGADLVAVEVPPPAGREPGGLAGIKARVAGRQLGLRIGRPEA